MRASRCASSVGRKRSRRWTSAACAERRGARPAGSATRSRRDRLQETGSISPLAHRGEGGQPTDRDRRFDRSHRRWRDVPFAGRSRKRPGDGDEQDRRSCACRARLVCRARVPPVYPHKSRVRSFHQVSRLRDSRGVSRLTSAVSFKGETRESVFETKWPVLEAEAVDAVDGKKRNATANRVRRDAGDAHSRARRASRAERGARVS